MLQFISLAPCLCLLSALSYSLLLVYTLKIGAPLLSILVENHVLTYGLSKKHIVIYVLDALVFPNISLDDPPIHMVHIDLNSIEKTMFLVYYNSFGQHGPIQSKNKNKSIRTSGLRPQLKQSP